VRRVMQASVGAVLAFAVLAGGAGAQSPSAAGASDVRVTPQARVIRAFGAALRADPSSDAQIIESLQCGDLLPVIGFADGWVQVQDGGNEGWVGGGRVSVGSPPAQTSACRTSRGLFVGEGATTEVDLGCLSLRATASREARILACVNNGHDYQIVDGPYDPGTGEDWFAVYSASTGTGWSLAEFLYAS
jgi:hypothetical protein